MKKAIITTNTDVIIGIGDNLSESTVEAGVLMLDGAGYGIMGQKSYTNVEVPAEVVPEKYLYLNGEFVLNPNYQIPEDEKPRAMAEAIEMLIEVQADMLGGAL